MKICIYPSGWHGRLRQGVGAYRPWLLDQGSLTRRIVARCPAFNVRPVGTQSGLWQNAAAQIRPQRALLREVYLYCGTTPVVYAHSVLPLDSLHGTWRSLRNLGERPLGDVLFRNPRVRRTPLQFRKLHRTHWLYRRACRDLVRAPAFLWARRSVFILKHRPIQVTEVFLPGILAL
mgnify:CR=1 FL=1